MLTDFELDDVREDYERILFDAQCVINRYDPEADTTDPETFERVRGQPLIVYDGPCFAIPSTRTYERPHEQGEEVRMARTYVVRIRWDAEDIRPWDEVIISNAQDPESEGVRMKVLDPQIGSGTVRILICEMAH